ATQPSPTPPDGSILVVFSTEMCMLWSRPLPLLILVAAAFSLVGCGSAGGPKHLTAVSGRVFFGTKPLPGGAITFTPNAAKGNTSTFQALGRIKSDGSYELFTEGQAGAPEGFYKVTIYGAVPGEDLPDMPEIPQRYQNLAMTPLEAEVKVGASPSFT